MRQIVWIDDLVDVPKDEVSVSSDVGLFRECAARLKALGLSRGRIGVAGGEVDWLVPLWLRDQFSEARIEDAAAVLDGLVVYKDEVELTLIRHAQRLIDEVAYPAYRKHLAVGAWDTTVFAGVVQSLLSAGADPYSMVLFDAGPSGSGTWAAGVRQRKIEVGDIVLSEPMPAVAGYQAERMFTFALGERISESQKRGSKVVHDAYQMSVEEFRPGREIAPLIEKTAAFLQSKGYDGPTVPLGHWIGSQNHEGPRFTREGVGDRRLEPGMVFSWHPNLAVPGEVRTCCSSCFVVTEKSVEPLSRLPVRPLEYV
jgi:Xaa-Pro dipeptidase